MNSGGESGGDAYPGGKTPDNADGDHDGQSQQGYSGGDNPNSTSTKAGRRMTAPRKGDTVLEADAQQHTAARPDRGQADDGKSGGQVHEGRPGQSNAPGGGAGTNAQSGATSGIETERHAPGMSTEKKADDTK